MADYYNESSKLHWDPLIERQGLGTLLKKVNHVAIIVSDVNRSLSFYTQILGLQQIRRPNFDRHGAWLTMGNCELHLIKEPEKSETEAKTEKSFEAIAIQMFRHFDKDNSGTLTREEICQILKSLHQSPSDETLDKMLISIDVNKDGSIDQEEFLKLVNSKPVDDEFQAFFALLDLDGNNMITCPELAMVIRSLNLPLHDSHIENLFIEADLDGNGVLSLEQVKRFVLG